MASQEEVLSLHEIETRVLSKLNTCRWCNGMLGQAESYNHSGGIPVKGMHTQWVYFTCLKCGYQWSLSSMLNRIRNEEPCEHRFVKVYRDTYNFKQCSECGFTERF